LGPLLDSRAGPQRTRPSWPPTSLALSLSLSLRSGPTGQRPFFFPFFFPEFPFSSPAPSFLRPPSALLGWKATAVTRAWQVTNPAGFPSLFPRTPGL